MALDIIGVGFGRTGTYSTCHALNQLGYPCYHMYEVLKNKENKTHLDFWNNVANAPAGQQHNWDEVFEKYTATVDNPGCTVWRELIATYPDAKVLLTLHPRGPETWYESTINTIYTPQHQWQFQLLRSISPWFRKMQNMTGKLIWERSHKDTMKDKSAAIARYNEHIEEIKAAVPPEKLLIFSVDQGWEPLCKFVDKPIPENDFPRVNDRAETKKELANLTKGILIMFGLAVIGLIALIYFLIKFLF